MTNPTTFPEFIATKPTIRDLTAEHIAKLQEALPLDEPTTALARTFYDFERLVYARCRTAVERAQMHLVLKRALSAWSFRKSQIEREARLKEREQRRAERAAERAANEAWFASKYPYARR